MIKQQVSETKTASSKPQGLPDEKLLKDLGFKYLSEKAHVQKTLAIAYEHYLRLTEDAWEFINSGKNGFTTTMIKDYGNEFPPMEILSALKQAKERKCFGEFMIAHEGKDPILLGRVKNGWKFFSIGHRPFVIAHWGDDFDPEWLEKSME